MNILNINGQITVDGKSYQGTTVSIHKGRVVVDGREVDNVGAGRPLQVTITGSCGDVLLQNGDVIVHQGCGGIEIGAGDLEVRGAVTGDVRVMAGDVRCGAVTGALRVECGDVRHG